MQAVAVEFDKIIDELYAGETITQILERRKIPQKTFYNYIEKVPSCASDYARARAARCDILVDKTIDVAYAFKTKEETMQARNIIQAMQWSATKIAPTVYGDRVQFDVNQNLNIAEILGEANSRIRQVTEITRQPLKLVTGCEPVEKIDAVSEAIAQMLE